MDEDVEMAAGAGARIVEQSGSAGAEALYGGGQIGDAQSDMVQAGATLLQEFCYRGIGRCGF